MKKAWQQFWMQTAGWSTAVVLALGFSPFSHRVSLHNLAVMTVIGTGLRGFFAWTEARQEKAP